MTHTDFWAFIGILIVAGVFSWDRTVGTLLFVIVALAMLYTIQRKKTAQGGGFSWTEPVPPTVH